MDNFEMKLNKITDEFEKRIDEINHNVTIECTWHIYDKKHMPTENGKYLVIDGDGDYNIMDFFKKGSVITTHKRNNICMNVIADIDGFYFFSHVDSSCPYLIDDVLGYIKISDINIFRVGEKNV